MTSSSIPCAHGFEGFKSFVQESDYQRQLLACPGNCLLDYVDHWLWAGPGVRHCFGDFHIFLSTVAIIIDEWHLAPDLLDFTGDPALGQPDGIIERRVTSVFTNPERRHAVFDPRNFTAANFHWQHIWKV